MRSQFDNMLEQLHTELVHMGALCEEAISGAAKLLFDEKEEREPVHAVEEEIDSLERKIEGLCMKLLLRQQPVAKDLREISSALKMISDMERIGDQAVDIADVAKYINKKQEENNKLQIMAEATIVMVTQAIESFVKKDLELAHKVMRHDDFVDELFAEIKTDIIRKIGEQREDGEYLADVLMVAKYFERIGDHAVNIAEWVEYSITGVHMSDKNYKDSLCSTV